MEWNTPGSILYFVWDTKVDNLGEEHGWAISTRMWACCWGGQALALPDICEGDKLNEGHRHQLGILFSFSLGTVSWICWSSPYFHVFWGHTPHPSPCEMVDVVFFPFRTCISYGNFWRSGRSENVIWFCVRSVSRWKNLFWNWHLEKFIHFGLKLCKFGKCTESFHNHHNQDTEQFHLFFS